MAQDPNAWKNFSPGDTSIEFPSAETADVYTLVEKSCAAYRKWAELTLSERQKALVNCRDRIQARKEDLARLISLEVGKPLREARMEISAVIDKFSLSFTDAEKYASDESVTDGPQPGTVRHRSRGPAAVIAPFNFPIHLGHGATVAYLLAGNTVLFKPSPFAINVALAYAAEMQAALPADVFQLVPGWGETGRMLCLHECVRSVCFTGSIPVGTSLSLELASDYSKSLALELGGKNSAIVCKDADMEIAANAIADGMCLTTGQRCNATSRVLVHAKVASEFLDRLHASLARFQPGNPVDENTMLGPLINDNARKRYVALTSAQLGHWIMPGRVEDQISTGEKGFYVHPAVLKTSNPFTLDDSSLATQETFAPILVVESFNNEEDAVTRHEAWHFGLTASIFTKDQELFKRIGDRLAVGNLYCNLPTTFSPSTLPFGGWGASGNGHPGGRGFIRFATNEQTIQWKT